MTAHVLLNPAARNGRAAALGPKILAALAAAGVEATLHATTAPGHATALAREIAGAGETVLAAGGDGTVHEAVNGAVGTPGVLGVLPLGTGNDYAQALGMSRDLAEATRQIASAPTVAVDVGHVRWRDAEGDHAHHFANGLGAGFDAHAAALAAETKWIGGRSAYVVAVLRTLWQWRRPTLTATVRDAEGAVLHEGPLFLCEVGNGHSVGGGFLITPDARPDDGLLDACAVRYLSTARALTLVPRTFSGGHVGAPEVVMARGPRFRLDATEGRFGIQADGEILTQSAVSAVAEVRAGALRVIAPGMKK